MGRPHNRQDPRPLSHRREAGRRRNGGRLQGPGPPPGPARGTEGPATRHAHRPWPPAEGSRSPFSTHGRPEGGSGGTERRVRLRGAGGGGADADTALAMVASRWHRVDRRRARDCLRSRRWRGEQPLACVRAWRAGAHTPALCIPSRHVPCDCCQNVPACVHLAHVSDWANFGVAATGVYFSADRSRLQFLDAATGKVSTLTVVDNIAEGLCVSPDGHYVVWAQRDRNTTDLMLVENFR